MYLAIVITVIALALLALFVLWIKAKVAQALLYILRTTVVLSVLLIISGLFFSWGYEFLVDIAFEQTGITQQVHEIDNQIPSSNPEDYWNDLWGGAPEEVTVQEGMVYNNVYEPMREVVIISLRILSVVLGIAGIWLVVYISFAVEGFVQGIAVADKQSLLEKRVKELEKKVGL
jgi:hypothetical protein